MTPSNDLHELVKSLDKSEKRYFRLCSSLQKGDKHYLKLFTEIEKQEIYDEVVIKKKFAGDPLIKQLAFHKNHLQSLIIKSLCQYNAGKTAGGRLREALDEAEVLYHKGLHKHCLKILDRAHKIAETQDKYPYLQEILYWKRQVMRANYFTDVPQEELDRISKEEQVALQKSANSTKYLELENMLSFSYHKLGSAKTKQGIQKYKKILNDPLLKNYARAETLLSQYTFHYTHGFYYLSILDFEKALVHFKKAHSVLIEQPERIFEHIEPYINVLSVLLSSSAVLGKRAEYARYSKEIRSIAVNYKIRLSNQQETRVFTTSYMNELLLHINLTDYTLKEESIRAIETGLKQWGRLINPRLKITFYFNLTVLFFCNGEHKKALHWIGFLLNANEKDIRFEEINTVRILELLIHYELGNYDLLEYRIKTDILYFRRRKKEFPGEIVLLKLLRDLVRETKKGEQMKLIEEARKEIMSILRSGQHRVTAFDYISWLDSKLTGKSYAEMFRRNQQMLKNINKL